MFGDKAAMFALLLFCLDPNFLAHGSYVTTDIGASLTMLAAVYAFYRYMQRPTVARMIIVGLAVGLAMTAKFTGGVPCSSLVPDRSHRLLAIGY
jgi:4-amino-4-deoxy-L-arabinose transferase-like glycosyltransferase